MVASARVRLRGTTLLAAPAFLLGLIAASIAVLLCLWGVSSRTDPGIGLWAAVATSGVVATVCFVAASGCYVELDDHQLRDVVGWITMRRIERESIVEARVRAGAWRWFEVELDDSRLVTLMGAGPAQFPMRLSSQSRIEDLHALALLRGDE